MDCRYHVTCSRACPKRNRLVAMPSKIVWLAVEVVLHQLDAFVEAVADLGVVVDPVYCVVWHSIF